MRFQGCLKVRSDQFENGGIMKAIEIKGLTKKYGDYTAVDNLSFDLECGSMLGFLGVNGAGKSTTINMLSTILRPNGGEVYINGYKLGESDKEIRQSIGVVYQQNVLDELLTVKDNIKIRAKLSNVGNDELKERVEELTNLLKLGDIMDKQYKLLSGGQKRRCEIAAALIHAPKILFLDEPTTGLDPATRIEVWEAIESLRENKNMTVFLTTHYMEEAASADKIVIINKGRKITEGKPFELKEKYAKDRLKLYYDTSASDDVMALIKDLDYEVQNYGAVIHIKNSLDALDICESVKKHIHGFEVIQGNMDDVFLNVTKEI